MIIISLLRIYIILHGDEENNKVVDDIDIVQHKIETVIY